MSEKKLRELRDELAAKEREVDMLFLTFQTVLEEAVQREAKHDPRYREIARRFGAPTITVTHADGDDAKGGTDGST